RVSDGVPEERERAVGRILRAGRVAQKRTNAGGGIFICRVRKQRPCPDRRVQLASGVTSQRKITDCGIKAAGGKGQKRRLPFCGVTSGVTAVRRRNDRFRQWQKFQARKQE